MVSKRNALAPRPLIDDLVTEMIEYLPTGTYRFIGGVSRQFRDAHRNLDLSTTTTLRQSLLSFDRAMIWAKEDEEYNGYDSSIYVWEALGCGNVQFLQWLMDRNTLQKSSLTRVHFTKASENGQLHAIQWLRSQDPPCPWDKWTCALLQRDLGIWTFCNGHVRKIRHAHGMY